MGGRTPPVFLVRRVALQAIERHPLRQQSEYSMTFESLSDAERSWLFDQLTKAAVFANDCGSADLPSLESLDDAFDAFVRLGDAVDANDVVLAVGAAFGEHLVRTMGFRWGIATDDYGTDIAVLARPDRGDITIFPVNFVAKRWERRETKFLIASIGLVEKTLSESAAEWGDP